MKKILLVAILTSTLSFAQTVQEEQPKAVKQQTEMFVSSVNFP